MSGEKKHTPKVFISSTNIDLEAYRKEVGMAANAAGILADLQENWTAKDHPPLNECLERVREADALVVIVAHRYGWVPEDQERNPEGKSITWLECEEAESHGKQLLAFVIHDDADWPPELKDKTDLDRAAEMDDDDAATKLMHETRRRIKQLKAFKVWLGLRGLRRTYRTKEELKLEVERALKSWHPQPATVRPTSAPADPTKYVQHLRADCGEISIRGLAVGTGKAHSFPIDELYIELSTAGDGEGGRGKAQPKGAGHRLLKQALGQKRLAVVGDPGSGKTTFLRWIAWVVTGDRLGETTDAAQDRLGLPEPYVPALVRIADWLEHIRMVKEQHLKCPTRKDAATWLPHYLGRCADDTNQGLDAEWFTRKLKAGKVLVLLDGLDEAPDERQRELALGLIRAVAKAYGDCPLVVTSRPVAYGDRSVLPGFDLRRIEPLGDDAVATFLTRWSQALFKDNLTGADKHRKDLLAALHARPNIRRLARNTVMLTALAVVHWNEKRLPEQRAELYESILAWLARSREQRPDRPLPERTLEILRELALAMQLHPDGRQVQVPRRWAAEQIAGAFGDPDNHAVVDQAERYLKEEEIDSGIVVARGHDIRFWHLTFQEYLAARAVGGRGEVEQRSLLLEPLRRFYAPEWREVVLLLGGVLYTQGRAKVDGLVQAVLDNLHSEANPSLAEQTRTAGLLGALVRDLTPFDYTPMDTRYAELMRAALAVFDRDQAGAIPVETRIEAADALGQAGDPRLEDEVLRWVAIPGGRFLMGAQNTDPKQPGYDQVAQDREAPPHWVELDPYYIGRWPVTVAEYALFLDDGGYVETRWWDAGGHGEWTEPDNWEDQLQHPNRPVTYVSWFEAAAYCAWLTERRKATGLSRSAQERVRLPTEAEWEFVARGTKGRKYPWGKTEPEPELLNFNGNIGVPTPVGIYPSGASPEGALDLAGNVWEWCSGWYSNEYYHDCLARGTVRNPEGPAQGDSRLLRGGSWGDGTGFTRAAARGGDVNPVYRDGVIGFRVLWFLRQD